MRGSLVSAAGKSARGSVCACARAVVPLAFLFACNAISGIADLTTDVSQGGSSSGTSGTSGGSSGTSGTSGGSSGTSGGTDASSGQDGALDLSLGYPDGTFETNLRAAFDGQVAQLAAQSARTTIEPNPGTPPLLYREFNCEMALHRVEVHAPTDSFFLYDASNYPSGGTGRITLVGRRADSPLWRDLASVPFGTTSPVVFDGSNIPDAGAEAYVAYGVRFASNQAGIGTLQVAELGIFGSCTSPPAEITWSTSPWSCTGSECVAATNSGTFQRVVECRRSTGGLAHEAMCSGPKPPATGGSCDFTCSYTLKYVGAKPFTYDNGSGWLHEGNMTSRAGPLPTAVDFGTTRQAIEGKPCSIRTENVATYFVGISCEPSGNLYCAFRCE